MVESELPYIKIRIMKTIDGGIRVNLHLKKHPEDEGNILLIDAKIPKLFSMVCTLNIL